jgi:transposase InsO family protein
VVQLPPTKGGHDAVLTFVDRLTKMVHLVPCTSNIDAVETANLFVKHIYKQHGMPSSILTDRGTQFTSKFFVQCCNLLGVKQLMSTAYHPQTDGGTEIVNRTFEEALRRFIGPDQDDWDDLLPLMEFAINNAKHASTQFTPFYLNYGYHPLTPVSLQLPWHGKDQRGRSVSAITRFNKQRQEAEGSDQPNVAANPPAADLEAQPPRVDAELETVPAVTQFLQARREALQRARSCLHAAQQRQKMFADKKRRPVDFTVHDRVLLSSKHIRLKHPGSRKLLPRWLGPFEITQEINPVAFKLNLPVSMQRLHPVFHACLLKPYKMAPTHAGVNDGDDPDHPAPPPPAPIILEDGDVLFEVDMLLDIRTKNVGKRRKRAVEYLVKWAGYGHEHNSWEPAINIADPDLITDLEQRLAAKAKTAEANSSRSKRRRVAS